MASFHKTVILRLISNGEKDTSKMNMLLSKVSCQRSNTKSPK